MTKQLEALIAEMKAAAEKSTQGNWRRASTLFNGITVTPLSLGVDEKMMGNFSEKRDSIFVTQCQPANVLALIAALEQSQLENDELRQRLANAEHQLHMAGLRFHNIKASRNAQFKKRKVAERRIAELEKISEHANRDAALVEQAVAHIDAQNKLIAELEASQLAVKLPQIYSMLLKTNFDEDYQSTRAFKEQDVVEAIRAAGGTVEGDE